MANDPSSAPSGEEIGNEKQRDCRAGEPKVERVWCDGHGMVYDSKRDCLWIAPGRDIYRYDFKTGQSEKVDAKVPTLSQRRRSPSDG